MRQGLIFLILFTLYPPCCAAASGAAIQGTAVFVDQGSGRLRLMAAGTMKVVNVIAHPAIWPAGVVKGSRIRAWGSFNRGKPPLFKAHKLSVLPSPGKGGDPTGVRSRLFRGGKAF